ncbi:hypothetical protein BJ166DRAFT_585658 [Pestalotiopsis sp. NC0098]|nr:hypothetical protein BJ166DRAFT_585658 [Pestalotiopsis sp. NC0098]
MHRKFVVSGEKLYLVPWHAVLRPYYIGLKAAIERNQGSDGRSSEGWEWRFSEFLEAGLRPASILRNLPLDHRGWDWVQNVPNFEQFCWAWRNSGNGARNQNGDEYDEWDMRRDIARNGRGWLVDAARRIYAVGFLASGDHAAAQLQVREAYRCLERWVRWSCERDLVFTQKEFEMAATCPSDAEFHLSYPRTFSPSNDECRAIPVRREPVQA